MRTIFALVVTGLLLAACGGTGSSPTPSGGSGTVDAAGDWRLVEGADGGVAVPLVAGHDITMSVVGSQISGRSACNHYGGEIVVEDGQIMFGAMSMTEMACEEPVMASESAFHAALAKVRAASRDGDRLTLIGQGVTLVFAWVEPPPTAEIVGTTWILDSLIAGEAVSSVMGDRATLVLAAGGTLSGGTGCRTFTGRWTEANGEILFTAFAMDQVECESALAAQDSHVVTVLGDGFRAAVEGRRLTLTGTGNVGLGYLASGE